MQHLDQEQPAKAIERNDSDKVVDRCDQRAGSNRRIDVDLLKNSGMQVPTALEISIASNSAMPMPGGNGKCEHHGLSLE